MAIKITKKELEVLASVVVDGSLLLYYMDYNIQTARNLVKRGLLKLQDKGDYEEFRPTRKCTKRLLHGTEE